MAQRDKTLIEELTRIDGHAPKLGIPKHKKMATSPFVFFRGSAQLFYADIQSGLIPTPVGLGETPLTTIMGDCHASNFGFMTEEGSFGDEVIFAPNDFDDACIGPPWWDLLRFSVSLALVADHCERLVSGQLGSENNVSGKVCIDDTHVSRAINQFLMSYLEMCQGRLDIQSEFVDVLTEEHLPSGLSKRYQKAVKRAAGGEQFYEKSSLAKAVEVTRVPLSFKQDSSKYQPVDGNLYEELHSAFAPFMDDQILDITQRMNAGTGSVNMQRFYFLVGPGDYAGKQDLLLCHLVEVKRQREAAPLHFFPNLSPINQLSPAHLTVVCQRRMQRRPDLILDEVFWRDAHWLVRSRHHAKMGIDPEHIGIGKRNTLEGGFVDYARSCGSALALAHCRSDRRSARFEQAMVEALPGSVEDIAKIALNYGAQVKRDQQWLASVLPK